MIGYALFLLVKGIKKKDNILEENDNKEIKNNTNLDVDKSGENKIRYLIATLIILLPVFGFSYMLIFTEEIDSMIVGIIVLILTLLYNSKMGLTHLERFYRNAKLLLLIITIFSVLIVLSGI